MCLSQRNLFHSRMKENQWAFDGNFKAFLPWRFQLRGVKGEFYAQPLPPLSWHRIMNLAFSIAKKFKPQKRGMHFIHHPCRKEIFHLIFGGKSPLRHLVVEGWSNCITIPTSNQHWTFTLCLTAIVCTVLGTQNTLLVKIKPYNTRLYTSLYNTVLSLQGDQ